VKLLRHAAEVHRAAVRQQRRQQLGLCRRHRPEPHHLDRGIALELAVGLTEQNLEVSQAKSPAGRGIRRVKADGPAVAIGIESSAEVEEHYVTHLDEILTRAGPFLMHF
jgi:hypothetical protein